jgi:hypothetical protein
MKIINVQNLLAAAVLLCSSFSASAIVIDENTAGLSTSTFFPGNSLTTPNGPGWNSIEFNWFSDAPGTIPTAFGTLFILTTEYLGAPVGLSAATPGYLAQSLTLSAGKYILDPSVVLESDTHYFFYANAEGLLSGNSDVPGENLYFAFSANSNFVSNSADANYRLTGEAVAVPVPSTLALLGIGIVGLLRYNRRQRAPA